MPDGPENDPRFAVTEEDGVIAVDVRSPFVRKELAVALCGDIERAAGRQSGEAKLVLDMAALSKASPAAGLYAMRRIRALGLRRIALVGGNRFIRGFARVVLTLGRFGSFAFFRDERAARDWASGDR